MAKLTAEQRNRLGAGEFVFPRDRSYPIPDASHARNALARAAQHGSAEQQKKVRDAVARRFPGIKEGK
jgi:hypothetical protein